MKREYENIRNSRITVIGIGGVGGYLAALLAHTYPYVTLVARGGRKDSLQEEGIRLNSDYKGMVRANPWRVVTGIHEIGEVQDFIFVCVKNYSLAEICTKLGEVTDEHTVVVPVMNGIEAGDRLRKSLSQGVTADASIHIVSYAEEDYSIRHIGSYALIRFGIMDPDETEQRALDRLEHILSGAEIDCQRRTDIRAAIWDKYMLNCAYNVLTAYYDTDVAGLKSSGTRKAEFRTLLEEAQMVARAQGIAVEPGFVEREYIRILERLEDDASSSLKRDMAAGREGELETFSGHLTRLAKSLGITIPLAERLYKELRQRADQKR